MIVSDNNALNSYLKTPPYFSAERGVHAVFEVAPPRAVPGVIQDRGTEQEARWAEEQRRRGTDDRPRDRGILSGNRSASRAAGREVVVYPTLPELRLARPGQQEVDARLSNQALIRTQLAHSGYLPRQLVIAGGHAFDTAAQARATFNASKVHTQRTHSGKPGAAMRTNPELR